MRVVFSSALVAILFISCSNFAEPVWQTDGSLLVVKGGSIQEAIDMLGAAGGTIVVEPGSYSENLVARSGTTLRSRQKYGAMISPSNPFKYCITGWGVSNVAILDFEIRGGVQFGQVTTDFSHISRGITISGNRISQNGSKDGIHLGGVDGAAITDNDVSDSNSEQGIDLVGVKSFSVNGNAVHNIRNSSGMGIVAKAGSFNGTISGNEVYSCGNAAIACGQISTELWIWPEALSAKYEARNIVVSNNNLHDNSKFAILVMGAVDSRIESNILGPSTYYALFYVGGSTDTHSPEWTSRNITIIQAGLAAGKVDCGPGGSNITLNGVTLP